MYVYCMLSLFYISFTLNTHYTYDDVYDMIQCVWYLHSIKMLQFANEISLEFFFCFSFFFFFVFWIRIQYFLVKKSAFLQKGCRMDIMLCTFTLHAVANLMHVKKNVMVQESEQKRNWVYLWLDIYVDVCNFSLKFILMIIFHVYTYPQKVTKKKVLHGAEQQHTHIHTPKNTEHKIFV